MKNFSLKKWLLATVLMLPLAVYAINTLSEGFRLNSGDSDVQIDAYSICKKVTNASGADYFVPTNTPAEWEAFRDNVPTGMTLEECVAYYTALLLHADGDKSTSGHDVTVNGNPQLTDTAKFGQAAVFDGVGDYMELADSDDWDFGSGDFTVDTWIKSPVSDPVNYQVVWQKGTSGGDWWHIYLNNWRVYFYFADSAEVTQAWFYADANIEANTWYHLAIVRNSTEELIFVNGEKLNVTVITSWGGASLDNISKPLHIGRAQGSYTNWSIDDLRITKGEAFWINDFTLPTAPATAGANTKLLLNMDGSEGSTTFTDSSTSAHTVIPNGNAKITGLADEFKEAMYFDGSGDYLSVADSADWDFGSGDFTVDFWFKKTGTESEGRFIAQCNVSSCSWATTSWWLRVLSNVLEVRINTSGGSYFLNGTTVIDTAWHHVALVRSGNSVKVYLDGQVEVSETITEALQNSPLDLYIAKWGANGVYNGYIDNLRITKGEALYTSNFTPSTTPSTTGANTKLLLDFDGDEGSFSAHPVTFHGDAQMVSGGQFDGAYSFDGSGDYLSMADSEDWDIEDGESDKFTIDFWIKTTELSYQHVLSRNIADATPGLYIITINYGAAPNKIMLYRYGTPAEYMVSTTDINDNTWHHVAIVRNGSNAYLFVDGNQESVVTWEDQILNINADLQIGRFATSSAYDFNGYLDEVRIVKGKALWSGNFIPPTSPYTE